MPSIFGPQDNILHPFGRRSAFFYTSISLVSGLAMSYEILLARLFSIIKWHNFGFMIISLALLGYGASGSFLTLVRPFILKRFQWFYAVNIFMFAASAFGCFLLAQNVPFNTQEMLWTLWQLCFLAAIYLLLALPFFFAANVIGSAIIRFKKHLPQLYAADLLGAGLGSAAMVGLLDFFLPQTLLRMLSAAAFALAAGVTIQINPGRKLFWSPIVCVMGLFFLPANWLTLHLSPYKELSQILNVSGTKLVHQESSVYGLLSVVESPKIPFRHAPGLSLMSSETPPLQLGLFTDGDNMTAINRYKKDIGSFSYLDDLTSAGAYHLSSRKKVLLFGTAGGALILQALYHKAAHITAVELNPHLVGLLNGKYADFCGRLYQNNRVAVHIGEHRGFIAQNKRSFDLIQMDLTDSLAASAAGLYALNEGYPYTMEAVEAYIRHLNLNGVLSLTCWVKLPPRDSLKLFATTTLALKRCGLNPASTHFSVIRGFQTLTMLVKKTGFTPNEINRLKRFCHSRAFDMVYYPGMPESEANQHNLLSRPYFYEAAQALLGRSKDEYMARYKFNIEPATDDKPFFNNFFKWSSLPEIYRLLNKGGMGLLESGYLILWAALLQALGFSILLILLPLVLLWPTYKSTLKKWAVCLNSFVFFFFLGLAFLFIEICFIQKFILFLNRPVYAMAAVISAFLIFAGLGSRFSRRWTSNQDRRMGINAAVLSLVVMAAAYLWGLGPVFERMLGWPIMVKAIMALIIIAPMAFCMGMPFALGLGILGESFSELLPWAWGINGCASVISAVCAPLLALYVGFTKVIMLALVLYILAAFTIDRMSRQSSTSP